MINFLILFCVLFAPLVSHEGHKQQTELQESNLEGRPVSWLQWLGGFHFIFLHYPIALITLLALTELGLIRTGLPIFEYSSRFMLNAAAVLVLPTAFFGLCNYLSGSYSGLLETYMLGHLSFGVATTLLTPYAALIRMRQGLTHYYYTVLVILFICINITGYLGGGLTFGPYHLLPPA